MVGDKSAYHSLFIARSIAALKYDSMPSMVSYPRRLQSGHITCYLNRAYHVLPTGVFKGVDEPAAPKHNV